MSERHDDITRLVKSVLKEGSASSTGWDEPSDAVWSEISGKLHQRRGRRGMIWFAVLVTAALGVLIYTAVPSKERITPNERTSQPVTADASDRAQPEVPATVDLPQADTFERLGAEPADVSIGSEITPRDAENTATNVTPASVSAGASTDRIPNPDLKTRVAAADQPEPTASQNAKAGPSIEDPVQIVVRQEIRLQPLGSTGSVVRHVRDHAIADPPEPGSGQGISRWTVNFFAGPSFGTRHIAIGANQPRLARMLLQQYEVPEVRWTYGASMSFSLNPRWEIGAGLEFAEFLLRSNHRKQIRYSQAGEMVNSDGRFESSYRVNFNSSYGRIETDIVVERESDAAIPEHDFINLDLVINQSLRFVRIPLFGRYNFHVGRVRMNGLMGVTIQHLQRSGIDIRMIRSLDQDVQRVRTLRLGMRGAQRTTLGFQLGVGVAFPVGERISVSAMPVLNASLDPVYNNGLYKVYPYTIDLRVGLMYRL